MVKLGAPIVISRKAVPRKAAVRKIAAKKDTPKPKRKSSFKRDARIEVDLGPGGSPWGQTLWRDIAFGCGKRAALRKQHPGLDMSEPLGVGIIFHALVAHYLVCDDPDFECSKVDYISQEYEEEHRIIAERTFECFREEYPVQTFGTIIGTEIPLPDDELERTALEAEFEMPGISARLDCVVKLSTADCKRYNKLFDMNLKPGNYIIDWKGASAPSNWAAQKYYLDLQPKLYQHMWNIVHPKQQVKGAIIFMVQRMNPNKHEFKSHVIFIQPLNLKDKKMIARFIVESIRNYPDYDRRANLDRCADYGKTCAFLVAGVCDRT